MEPLSHFDQHGHSRMVDVSAKAVTQREAVARGRVTMQPATFARIVARDVYKGDVLEVARLAGIMGAKQTSTLIPLCHPLPIASVELAYTMQAETSTIVIDATVRTTGQTGVEMEALTAVTVAALTIYDMCKAMDRGIVISAIRLIKKSGGKSGTFIAEDLA